jgi:hypothetical protein
VAVVALLLLAVCLWPLLGQSWVFLRSTDLDINSGRLRHQVHVLSVRVCERTEESALSREIRRLGIQTPSMPIWKCAGESRLVRSVFVNYRYGGVLAEATTLVMELDLMEMADEDRRVVLGKFMEALQSGDPERAQQQAWLLKDEIGEQQGREVFTPEFKSYLQTLRSSQGQQQSPTP